MPETPKGYCSGLPYPADVRPQRTDPLSLRTVMETGRVRIRPMESYPRRTLELTWNFQEDKFELFQRWFKINLENGTRHFLLTGIIHGDGVTAFTLAFYPAGIYELGHSDNHYVVRATCEVIE